MIDFGDEKPDPNLADGEAALDLQMAMPIIYPQSVELYQTHDNFDGSDTHYGFLNQWLDALDGSYCSYEGADDPTIDDSSPGEMCGEFKPTNVIFISYGLTEVLFPNKYNQVCQLHPQAQKGH